MTSKKKTPTSSSTRQQTLKIGSRVRCTDDGVEGRIVWANAVSVKIRWSDGEQVTWRRDSLADRPIEIVEGSEDQSTSAIDSTTREPTEQIESPPVETEEVPTTAGAEASPLQPDPTVMEPTGESPATATASTEQHSQSPAEPTESLVNVTSEMTPPTDMLVKETTLSEPAREEQRTPERTEEQPEASAATTKPPRKRNAKKAAEDGKVKKLSALDAAAKVLAEAGQAMTCQEMIAAMAEKGYWTSPGGKTPQATLYSAMLREITTKGANSRFQKTERGKFSRSDAV
jgi:hypothetical protein